MGKPHKLTYKEKRAKLDAWLHHADEVLAEYGEVNNGVIMAGPQPEPPDAA